MFKFVALLWDATATDARESACLLTRTFQRDPTAWESIYRQPGIEIFCAGLASGPSKVYRLHGEQGAVLGVLFDRSTINEPTCQKSHLTEPESHRICTSRGRDLLHAYWGRYVAFVRARDSRSFYVLRDPSGAVACYTAKARGVELYFSSLQDVPPLENNSLSIDWEHVAATACGPLPESRCTGFNEVSRILRGECVETGTRDRFFYWNPARLTDAPAPGDFDALARELRATVRSCVQTWASCYRQITQSLSGGLDSSIIASAAIDAPNAPELTCLNYFYAPGSGGDEREYARLVADHLRCRLVERELTTRVALQGLRDLRRAECPTDLVPYYLIDQTDANAAPLSPTVRFHGFGGDQLFYQNGAQQAVADYLLGRHLDRQFLRFAAEAARAEDATIWSVINDGLGMALLRNRLAPAIDIWLVPSVVRPEVREQVRLRMPFVHRWLHESMRIPPGKVWQIHLLTLAESERTYDPFWRQGSPENVSPLMSQPVVELCLRIPSYVLMAKGRDRALARHAFGGDLPKLTTQRRSKGLVCEHPKAILDANRAFIRETLLDGWLVRERILDRGGVEAALSSEVAKHDISPGVIFGWLSVEIWAQQRAALRVSSMAA